MPQGKFSQPRPYRDEERQIEEAFRQVTEKNTAKKSQRKQAVQSPLFQDVKEETIFLPEEQRQIREAAMQEMAAQQEAAARQQEPPIEELISAQIQHSYPDAPASPAPEVFSENQEEPEWDPEDFEEEDYDAEPEDFLEKAMAFFSSHRTGILAALFCAALAMILGVVGIFAAGFRAGTEETILNNVIVAGVNVGGMTKKEAVNAVRQATSRTYTRQDMVIRIAGTEIRLSPEDTQASLDVKAAVEAAWAYGHTGTQAEQDAAYRQSLSGNHTVGLLPYLNLDLKFIQDTLNTYATDTGSTLTQASYGLEGSYPKLKADQFDPDSAQTLVLTMGTPGITFDAQKVYEQVLDAYSLHVFEVTVTEVAPAVQPDPVDLEVIYEEFYVAPVDSRINMQTFEIIPGSYGYEFDLDAAQRQVDMAQYGDVLRIPMVFIEPRLMEEDILFRDVLGESRTALSSVRNHAHNIETACKVINGTVLQPGETFSFHNVIGEPTSKKGYKEAPVYSGDSQTEEMGGGISQVSSALYHCALLSDLEIVSRTNHSFPVSYLDYGMDADVAWDGPDFQFRNSTGYPVRIQATVSGSSLVIQLIGTDDRDYFVKLEYSITDVQEPKLEYADFPFDNAEGYRDGDEIRPGISGYTVKTYKVKYSHSTGQQLSRDFITTSRYNSQSKMLARVAPEETAPPETTLPETTVPETTVPETTVPETTVPETTVSETTDTSSSNSDDGDTSTVPEEE